MMRVHPRVVVGMDVSDPVNGNIFFNKGIAEGAKTIYRMKNYGPKVSFKVLDNLAIGGGLDVTQVYRGRIGFSIPWEDGAVANINAKTISHAHLGWNVGVLYKPMPTTIIGASYHSKQNMNIPVDTEITTPGGEKFTSHGTIYAPTPDVASLNVTQIFSRKFLVSLTGRFIHWKIVKNFKLTNAPLTDTLRFPLNYKNAWSLQAVGRYKFAEKWAGLLAFEYDSSLQAAPFSTIGLPAYSVWIGGVGVQYMPTKNVQAQLVYGFAYSNPKIRNAGTGSFGKEKLFGNLIDASLTYKF